MAGRGKSSGKSKEKAAGRPSRARPRRNEDEGPAAVAEEVVVVPALLDAAPAPASNPPKCNPPAEAWAFCPIDAVAWRRFRQPAIVRNAGGESYGALSAKVEGIRERINGMRRELYRFFVGREDLIDLMVVSTAAQEPFLIVGPPGTGKSDLVVKFCEALGLEDGEYFEYMLTKFTDPSEVFGPVDIQALKDGKHLRRTQGKLPEAQVAFLDEIFRGNSAILNSMLTIVNERKFYQDGRPVRVPLKMLFAASNRIPDFEELEAVRDRFALKAEVGSVKDDRFDELIEKGLAGDLDKALGRKPWANLASLEDFIAVRRYMDLVMSGEGEPESRTREQRVEADRKRYFPQELYDAFQRLLRTVEREAKVYVSDRKVIRLYRLIRTQAFLLHGGQVRKEDLKLLRYVGDRADDLPRVREVVDAYLKL